MGSAEDTKARILRAAEGEFAEHGIAGARIRSIAAAAGVNLERIYAYFGDKESLYLEVLEAARSQMVAAVSLDPAHTEDYVANVFDYTIEHEELARLSMWGYLEGVHNHLAEDHPRMVHYRVKLAAMRDAQDHGAVDPGWRDTDLLMFLGALASAWRRASSEVHQIDRDAYEDSSMEFHRAAAVEAARRVLEPRAPRTNAKTHGRRATDQTID